MPKGTVYALSNPAMDGYVKIGKTSKLEQRLKSLDNTSTPLPFRCVFAVEVEDMDQVERLAHEAFKKYRVRSNREFFEIDEEQAVAALKISGGKDVTPRNDVGEDAEAISALDTATRRRGNFKFSLVRLSAGAELEYVREPSVKAIVTGDTTIEFEGQSTSLSSAALDLLHREGLEWKTVNGPQYWMSEGVVLSELRKRIENE
jgi:hypothetical protein